VSTTPADLTGMVFWRDGIDWRTQRKEELDHAERVLLAELAPHIKAFDAYPGPGMLEGSYVLSQTFNGDARNVILEDRERYAWVLGAPKTEMWIDNWAIVSTARNPDAAHAWIDFMLEPEVAARETAFHGYATAVTGVRALLPASLALQEMIFPSEAERARLVPGEITAAHDRIVAIYNRVKARAGA
jgi:spermidine/putrescine transport system substrate-binding protein